MRVSRTDEEVERPEHVAVDVKNAQPLRRTAWQFLNQCNTKLTSDPAAALQALQYTSAGSSTAHN